MNRTNRRRPSTLSWMTPAETRYKQHTFPLSSMTFWWRSMKQLCSHDIAEADKLYLRSFNSSFLWWKQSKAFEKSKRVNRVTLRSTTTLRMLTSTRSAQAEGCFTCGSMSGSKKNGQTLGRREVDCRQVALIFCPFHIVFKSVRMCLFFHELGNWEDEKEAFIRAVR